MTFCAAMIIINILMISMSCAAHQLSVLAKIGSAEH